MIDKRLNTIWLFYLFFQSGVLSSMVMVIFLSVLTIMELFLLFLITCLRLWLSNNDESLVLKLSDFLFTESSSFWLRIRAIAVFFGDLCLLFSLLVFRAILTLFTVIFSLFTLYVFTFESSSWLSITISSVTLLASTLLVTLLSLFGLGSLSERSWLTFDFD